MLRIPVVMPFLSLVITIIIQKRERPPRNVSSDKEMIPKMGFVRPRLAQEEAEASRSNSQPPVYELSNNTRNKSSLNFFSPAFFCENQVRLFGLFKKLKIGFAGSPENETSEERPKEGTQKIC